MESLTLPASLEHLPVLLAFVKRKSEESGIGERAARDILLAAEEMLMNIISYAYPGGSGSIRIDAGAPDARPGLRLQIEDGGIAFDPLARPEPDLNVPLQERQIGGLGIFLSKRKVDRLTYERKNGVNILVMEKLAPSDVLPPEADEPGGGAK